MRIIAPCLLCGKETINEKRPLVCYDCSEKDISTQDMRMGKEWRENSSLEKWFPFSADKITKLEAENVKLKAECEDWLWIYSLIVGILKGLPGYQTAKETSPLGKTIKEGVRLAKQCRAAITRDLEELL
jgi:hypothetical protein